MAKLILPDRRLVPPLRYDEGDHLVRLIYHPITGFVYRSRFQLVLEALEHAVPYNRLLEVGFGAGLLLPSLAKIARHVEGVDVHDQIPAVQNMLGQMSLHDVRLQSGNVCQLPYPNRQFSHVIAVSVLEHLRELDMAIRELRRVAQPGGWVILGIPTKNLITKWLFRVLGYRDDEIHPSSHRDILRAAQQHLSLERMRVFPLGTPLDLSLYIVARFRVPGPVHSGGGNS